MPRMRFGRVTNRIGCLRGHLHDIAKQNETRCRLDDPRAIVLSDRKAVLGERSGGLS